jgi:hypothetical protein
MTACAAVSAAVPTIRITAHNNQMPTAAQVNANHCVASNGTSGMNIFLTPYVAVTQVEVSGASNPAHNFTRTTSANTGASMDSLRRRGNSTATAGKIPFRIKFDKKVSMFGRPSAKSWTLLANYYDPTFMLNAIAFELGKRMELEYTPNLFFVNLYVNGNYQGLYQFTDQIQVGEASVNIDKDFDWLAEFDYHCPNSAADRLRYFHTGNDGYNINVKIRSPELDELPLVNGLPDTSLVTYRAVKNDINTLINRMSASGFPENGYRDHINLESFAKYVLIQLLMDNYDFNVKAEPGRLLGSNYTYKEYGKKIKAGPLWDFDLAAGVGNDMTFSHFNNYTDMIRPTHAFYLRLWEDPVFLAKYKKAWDASQNHFSAMHSFIDSLSNLLSSSVEGFGGNVSNSGPCSGFEMMGMCMGTKGPLTQAIFNSEVAKLKTWWTNRVTYFGQQINNMNIDTSVDIPDDPVSAVTGANFKSFKKMTAVRNGINLRVAQNAFIKVFNLSGREVRSMRFKSGNHSVNLGGLPKGVYMVKAAVDGEKQVLRVSFSK